LSWSGFLSVGLVPDVGACGLGKIIAITHSPNARYTTQTKMTGRTTITTSLVHLP